MEKVDMDTITLAHGSGGKLTHDLIEKLFLKELSNPTLKELADSGVVNIPKGKIAFSIDSFVVKPLFFPGGDIGKLAICGTVNDLAVVGSTPQHIACAIIAEEGLKMDILRKVTRSIKVAAKAAGVKVITGDMKVVAKGECDGLFVITAGVGVAKNPSRISIDRVKPGDKIILSGTVGDHGIAVLEARERLGFQASVKSDCAPLNGLIDSIITKGVKFMRDPTRGGLATTLNEMVKGAGFGIEIDEGKVPVSGSVKAACELLGFDPLYIANEGKIVVVVASKDADRVLKTMRRHRYGKDAAIIGEVVTGHRGKVYSKTSIGGMRMLTMLTGAQLPRIC
ncbi:MAG: hydrogenase expression/formation protein HypE [Candidatus Omnitrophica bacterium]|nr:hydrogenase expression/formation protein HypE [Candidatus Omnitrophota bacterium]